MIVPTFFCRVFFKVSKRGKVESISGEVDKCHLFSEENKWIVVKNKIFTGDQVITSDSVVYKANIVEIQAYTLSEKMVFENFHCQAKLSNY